MILEKDLPPEKYKEYTSFIMGVSYKGEELEKEIFDIEMMIEHIEAVRPPGEN
ncbi:hypothetical protein H9655_17650 [Cytobacillus sp. Sa5YUA1]|uniref:Uncharacterized protein n=1 Tax=Cytobacillus stercorigallinarum TaxID=2762240 RepID=A0ABR8QTV7_9BACI|nr:hypothetical protein [Cytobacillus stercorigallinarum]